MAEKRILMLVTSADRLGGGTSTGLWLEEFAVPCKEFTDAGHAVVVASPAGGSVPIDARSTGDDDQPEWKSARGILEQTEILAEQDAGDFDAIFIAGGHGTMVDFPGNPDLGALLLAFDTAGKSIAAVCHGPAAFVGVRRAGDQAFVAGRRLTAFSDSEERAVGLHDEVPFLLEARLREEGARYAAGDDFAEHTERDGRLITGQNPASSGAVARLLMRALNA